MTDQKRKDVQLAILPLKIAKLLIFTAFSRNDSKVDQFNISIASLKKISTSFDSFTFFGI